MATTRMKALLCAAAVQKATCVAMLFVFCSHTFCLLVFFIVSTLDGRAARPALHVSSSSYDMHVSSSALLI